MIRVALADDQRLIREGLRALLAGEADLSVAGEAATGADAVELCARIRIDVVLMDLHMPVLDGVQATARIRALRDPPAVLVLTTFDTDDLVFAALRAGASGFLLKDAPAETIFAGLRVVAAGEATLSPVVARRLIAHVAASAPPSRPAALEALTPREREVLVAIAHGRSNSDIAVDLGVSEATVKTHVGRVFEKLGVRDRAQAVIAAYESGLVRPAPPAPPPAGRALGHSL